MEDRYTSEKSEYYVLLMNENRSHFVQKNENRGKLPITACAFDILVGRWRTRQLVSTTCGYGTYGKLTVPIYANSFATALFFETCGLSNPDPQPSRIIYLWILGTFVKLRKATISFVISVCTVVRVRPSVLTGKLRSHGTGFHVIRYLSILLKSVEKLQVSLKSNNNNGHCTWRALYIYDNI